MSCGGIADQLGNFLAANGVDATYFRSTTTGYNTATGRTTRTEPSTVIKGSFVNFRDFLMPGDTAGVIGGEASPRTGRRAFTIAGNALTGKPAANDRLTVQGENFKVVGVEGHYLGNDALAFTLTLMRA